MEKKTGECKGECGSQSQRARAQEQNKKEGTLCLGIIYSQIFMGLHSGPPPRQSIVSQARVTGKYLPYVTATSLRMHPPPPL